MEDSRPSDFLNHSLRVYESRYIIADSVLCLSEREYIAVFSGINKNLAGIISPGFVAGSDGNACDDVFFLLYADDLGEHEHIYSAFSACRVDEADECFMSDMRFKGYASCVPVASAHRFAARVVIILDECDKFEVYTAFLSAHVVHSGNSCSSSLASDEGGSFDDEDACAHSCGLDSGRESSSASSCDDDVV